MIKKLFETKNRRIASSVAILCLLVGGGYFVFDIPPPWIWFIRQTGCAFCDVAILQRPHFVWSSAGHVYSSFYPFCFWRQLHPENKNHCSRCAGFPVAGICTFVQSCRMAQFNCCFGCVCGNKTENQIQTAVYHFRQLACSVFCFSKPDFYDDGAKFRAIIGRFQYSHFIDVEHHNRCIKS